MPNSVNQTQEIHYISQRRKICVGRNNQPVEQLITFDYRITDTYSFSVINAINQIVNIGGKSYQIYGSFVDAKGELHVIFYANSYTIEDNVLTFVVDTYTNEYLEYIKSEKEIDLTIVASKGERSEVILRDRAIAHERPYVQGREPLLIVYNKIFDATIPVSGQFGAGTDIDLVVGTPSFAFGEGLKTNDTNQIVFGQYNVEDATKVLIVGGGTASERQNIFTISDDGNVEVGGTLSTNALYINGTEVDTSTFETAADAAEKYNTLTGQIEAITTGGIADLTTDVDTISGNLSTAQENIDIVSGSVGTLSSDLASTSATLTGQINDLTTGQVATNTTSINEINNTLSSKADLSSVYTKEEVYTYIQTDAEINKATSGKADLSAVQAVDDKFANYYTSTQVDAAISTAIDEIDISSTVYTGEDGIKVENGVISLTATIPTKISDLTNDSEFATSAQVSSIVEGYGYITEIPTSYVQQSELETVSGQLNNAIGAKANTTDVEAEFTATSAWANETFLTEHQSLSSYYTKSEVDSAIGTATNDMATTGWVDTNYAKKGEAPTDVYTKAEVNAISTALSSAVSGAGYLTEIPTSYVQKSEISDMATQTWVGEQGFLTEVPNTVSAAAVNAATGWVQDKNYLSSINVIQQDTEFDENTSKLFFNTGFSLVQTEDMVRVDIDTNSIATKDELSSKADETEVEYISSFVSGLPDQISSKADSSAIAEMATTGYVTSQISPVQTEVDGLSSLVSAILEVDIPTSGEISGIASAVTTGYLTDYYTKQEADSTFLTASVPTNQQTTSAGFTYDSATEIFKNTYTPTNGVITLGVFEVPAGSLDSNKVATFEQWVYANGTLTGFDFNGVTLIGEIPEEISQKNYYVFTRRILGSGEQLISFAYADTDWNNVPLTFKGLGSNNSIQLNTNGGITSKSLKYSKNDGEWTNYNANTSISFNEGETVSFSSQTSGLSQDLNKYYQFALNGSADVLGNIQSLVNFDDNNMSQHQYAYLFKNCSGIVDASKLKLPPTLSSRCYYHTFENCYSLTAAPQFPNTTFSYGSFEGMYMSCSSLIKAPSVIPMLTGSDCRYMFQGCTSLRTAPQLPATEITQYCYEYMFSGCTSLTSAPSILPATTLAASCYNEMFRGCTSLTEAPYLPANYLNVSNAYKYMFYGCSSLSSMSVGLLDWNNGSNSYEWVSGVAADGVFYKPEALPEIHGRWQIPANWTVYNM